MASLVILISILDVIMALTVLVVALQYGHLAWVQENGLKCHSETTAIVPACG